MKIGFDGKRATHNFRGLGNYSRGIIEGLTQYSSNNSLYLYTPSFEDPRAINWIESHKNLQVRTPNNLLTNLFPSMWRSFLLEGQIQKDQLDIYHGLSHEIPSISHKRDYKVAVTIHDLIYLRYPHYFPKVDRIVYDKKFKYSTSNSDLIIAICEQTKSDLINFFGVREEKIQVHYQSCSPAFYNLKSEEELNHFRKNHNLMKPYILNVGAFEERKNQKNALLAFSKIADKYEIDLILVGNGKKYLHDIKAMIQELKLESRVKVLTNFPFHSLPTLYQAANLFLFTSHFEGFGIPIIEALFSKIPVITSKGSCFPESAGPYSLYFDPNNIDEIAYTISRVIENSDLKLEMINKSYEFVQKFHLQNSTSELVKIYNSILN